MYLNQCLIYPSGKQDQSTHYDLNDSHLFSSYVFLDISKLTKLKSCSSISSKVTSYLPRYYNKKNQIHVLKTSTEISGFAFFSNNPNNFVTLLYTYFSQQNHEILSIFKYFLEAELKS